MLAGVLAPVPLSAADDTRDAPTGVWQTTNDCFLAAFVLIEDGRAQAVYSTGQRDENAIWTWADGVLRIVSLSFPSGRFTGHLTKDRLEADYIWNDSQRGRQARQACVFERYNPIGI
jgi:hypothetical protein